MKAIGVRPTRGDFGLPDACIIKPGDPWASTLYFRMAKFGRDRMPHIGAERPDEAGLKLIEAVDRRHEPGRRARSAPPPDGPPDKLLADPKSAMLAARQAGARRNEASRARAAAGRGGQAPGRPGPRSLRGLPAPAEKRRSESSAPIPGPGPFWRSRETPAAARSCSGRKSLNCGSCHKIGTRGTPLGPDLSAIGKLRAREDLLESILEPSRRIEPKYAAYVVQTADGRSLTGLLVKRDANEVVLRDGQNKEIVLAAEERGGAAAVAAVADARRTTGRPDRSGSGRPARIPRQPQVIGNA